MPAVLLTGFEPFDDQVVNPSWQAVQRVAEMWNGAEHVVIAELPVEFGRAGDLLVAEMERVSPSLVIAVGQAGGRTDLAIERVAVNLDDARMPDNAGAQPIDVPVAEGGPAAYFSTLPVKACVADLMRAGVPGSVSHSAGTFVCNHVFYRLMHTLGSMPDGVARLRPDRAATDHYGSDQTADNPPGSGQAVRGGFVHVPFSPEQAAGTRSASMSVDTIAAGLTRIICTSLAVHDDVRLAGGALH